MDMLITVMWFRRDLRLFDNAALYHALKNNQPVLPLFIFDTNILDELNEQSDIRVAFIHNALEEIHLQLVAMGSGMKVMYGDPINVWKQLISDYSISKVFANRDYEPYARQRDRAVELLLKEKGIEFHTYKDQVIFEQDEILKEDGQPYTVFTPYSKKWKARLKGFYLKSYPCEKYYSQFLKYTPDPFPSIETIGFRHVGLSIPPKYIANSTLHQYAQTRDYPALQGTSRLSVHLRFGTISIRQLAQQALQHSEKFLNELIWREFYQMILWHFPYVIHSAFRKELDNLPWKHDEEAFERWRTGTTGFPMVDAGMRELNATGYMHNRLRMITAGFLTKHLLIDWRWGESYFAEKLLDYDLASNNGGWQWAAGIGVDAAPYFRIFNPLEQARKFDPHQEYIRRWIPEIDTPLYPAPMIDHHQARQRALQTFKKYANIRGG